MRLTHPLHYLRKCHRPLQQDFELITWVDTLRNHNLHLQAVQGLN